jgi:hypothetical protein
MVYSNLQFRHSFSGLEGGRSAESRYFWKISNLFSQKPAFAELMEKGGKSIGINVCLYNPPMVNTI